MSTKFELFRLTLLLRAQKDAFTGEDPTREEYLRKVFSEKIVFNYHGNMYHFVPEPDLSDNIVGRIGRPLVIAENRPPEEGLEESLYKTWKAAYFVIDPKHHKDGQKVAVSYDKQVGSSAGLLNAIIDAINTNHSYEAYTIEVEAITDAQNFWQFAEKHKGEITTITFEFMAPNMFGGADRITEEMRQMRLNEKVEKVKFSLTSSEGLNVDTERVKDSLDYVERGTGKITAKTKSGKRYSSADKKASTVLPPSAQEDDNTNLVDRVKIFASWILGHE